VSALTWVLTSRSLGYLFGSVFGGAMYDKYPHKGNFFMTISLVVSGISTAIIPFTPYVFVLSASFAF
jgi:MFS family permease